MTTTSSWRKRTEPDFRSFFGRFPDFLRFRYASTPRRAPAGLNATASMTAGESLVSVYVSRRSERATKTSVTAKTNALARVLTPRQHASPAATMTPATPQAAHDGSAG